MGVLKIKFENWNFGKVFRNGNFKHWNFGELNLEIEVLKIKFENWSWKFFEKWSCENYLKIEILKSIWELEFWKLNLRIKILKNYLKMEVLKIKFGNSNFWKIKLGYQNTKR